MKQRRTSEKKPKAPPKAVKSESSRIDAKEFRRLLRKVIEENRELLEEIGRL